MGSARRASLVAAASIAAVEALKDQAGLCRWNYSLRSLHQHVKSELRCFSQARSVAPPPSFERRREEAKRSEESVRQVMFLSCWGPN